MPSSPASSVTRSNSNEKPPLKPTSTASSSGSSRSRSKAEHDIEKQEPIDLPTAGNLESSKNAIHEIRRRWWLPAPREPFPSIAEAPVTPYADANWFSQLTFHWIQPMLTTGYQRVLVPTDLWKLNENFEAGHLSDLLLSNFEKRRAKVDKWNQALEDGSYKPGVVRRTWWKIRKTDGKRKAGLALALSDT